MPRKTSPTVADAVAEYQQTRGTYIARTTLANDWSLLRAFVKAMGPDKQIHTLTPQQVERWFAGEAKRQKASSYNKVRTRVKGFLEFSGSVQELVTSDVACLRGGPGRMSLCRSRIRRSSAMTSSRSLEAASRG